MISIDRLDQKILDRINKYHPKDGLGKTAKSLLARLSSDDNYSKVKKHSERVALLSEEVARKLKKDKKAAFFAGLLHDVGKSRLPSELFDGHEITDEEYERVKKHAFLTFEELRRRRHMFTALCAGFVHNVYNHGYGITMEDFPKNWKPTTIKKVLEISAIISICDFVDSFNTRKTKIKGQEDKNTKSLKSLLKEKYPDDSIIIEATLGAYKDLDL